MNRSSRRQPIDYRERSSIKYLDLSQGQTRKTAAWEVLRPDFVFDVANRREKCWRAEQSMDVPINVVHPSQECAGLRPGIFKA